MKISAKKLFGVLSGASMLLALAFCSPASAQSKKKRQPRVIQLEEIRIEGRVQKPNAFYILNRSTVTYEVRDLKRNFIPNIARSVQRDPF